MSRHTPNNCARTRTHSRIRTAVAALAAAPLAAGALLVGGASLTSADAAEVKAWERLANCESGKRWHINTGNGYSGGLQLAHSTWDAYAKPRMKNQAHKASKKAQILTAEKILDDVGWGAWPACSNRLGLGPKQAKGKPYDNKH